MFNTLAYKNEKAFQAICKTFEKEGVTTVEQVQACRQTMLSNAKVYVAFVVIVGLSLAMLFSTAAIPLLSGTGMLVIYIVVSTHRGRKLAQRYSEEILTVTLEAE